MSSKTKKDKPPRESKVLSPQDTARKKAFDLPDDIDLPYLFDVLWDIKTVEDLRHYVGDSGPVDPRMIQAILRLKQ